MKYEKWEFMKKNVYTQNYYTQLYEAGGRPITNADLVGAMRYLDPTAWREFVLSYQEWLLAV
jgi:hypothetical protein